MEKAVVSIHAQIFMKTIFFRLIWVNTEDTAESYYKEVWGHEMAQSVVHLPLSMKT